MSFCTYHRIAYQQSCQWYVRSKRDAHIHVTMEIDSRACRGQRILIGRQESDFQFKQKSYGRLANALSVLFRNGQYKVSVPERVSTRPKK